VMALVDEGLGNSSYLVDLATVAPWPSTRPATRPPLALAERRRLTIRQTAAPGEHQAN